MLSRRTILLAGAALAAAGGSCRAIAAPPVTAPAKARKLRMGYLLPTDSQLGAGATAMAEEVARRTGGRIQIEQFPDAALGGEVEMLKGVQLGTIDLAFITGAPLPNILPEAGIFNIPFLFDSPAHAHAVLDGPIGESYLRDFCPARIWWRWPGARTACATSPTRSIRSPPPEDLKGLKLRLPQSPVMLLGFRAMGADASPLPFPQLYGALAGGRVRRAGESDRHHPLGEVRPGAEVPDAQRACVRPGADRHVARCA